jgi:diguanylate cyclase (GGDEF)-like protein
VPIPTGPRRLTRASAALPGGLRSAVGGADVGSSLVGGRITGATRAGDTVSRLGGDEFAVLLEDAADPLQTAARIRDALQPVFVLADAEHIVRASVGVAAVTADDPPVTADTLLPRSDAAMYGAKRAGKATIARFEAATGEVVHAGRLLPAQS